MIYQTVTSDDFVRAFDDMGRGNQFTYLARRELFDWYDDLSDSLDDGFELDVIGICCDWAEYTAEGLIWRFGYLIDFSDHTTAEFEMDDEFPELIEALEDHGTLIIVEHVMDDATYLFMEQ